MKSEKPLIDSKNKSVEERDRLLKEFFSGEKPELRKPGEKAPLNIKHDENFIDNLSVLFEGAEEIFILAGELNPAHYDKIITRYGTLFEKGLVCIVGGPYIAIEDNAFLKYYDVRNGELENWWFAKRKNNWWEDHPVLKVAYGNEKIKIYITKQRLERHFCVSKNTKNIYIESPHDELEKSEGEIYQQNERLTKELLEIWNAIKECYCYEWDKGGKPERALFKPISIFEKEKAWKGKIEKEFSKSLE